MENLLLQARKQVNKLDNLTTSKAIDALLNYETVKLFNNEQLEVPFSRGLQYMCSRLPSAYAVDIGVSFDAKAT